MYKLIRVYLIIVKTKGFTQWFKKTFFKIGDRSTWTQSILWKNRSWLEKSNIYVVDKVRKCHTKYEFEGLFWLLSRVYDL